MKLHAFMGLDGWYALTKDGAGSNLPADKGPWRAFRSIDMAPGEYPRWGVSTEKALSDIEAVGYHLTQIKIFIERAD